MKVSTKILRSIPKFGWLQEISTQQLQSLRRELNATKYKKDHTFLGAVRKEMDTRRKAQRNFKKQYRKGHTKDCL